MYASATLHKLFEASYKSCAQVRLGSPASKTRADHLTMFTICFFFFLGAWVASAIVLASKAWSRDKDYPAFSLIPLSCLLPLHLYLADILTFTSGSCGSLRCLKVRLTFSPDL
eukprot:g8214.t1